MSTLSAVNRCLRLATNTVGRDWVVGDLHGHRSLLEQELARLRFDPSRDRLFSVGDLIDRGPDSLGTLALIEEPWFHAVLGNHELMLLNFLGYYSSRVHSRRAFASGAGQWVLEAKSQHRKLLFRLADRVAALPLVIHVPETVPFSVMHGDLQPIGTTFDCLLRSEQVGIHRADDATSSRYNFGVAQRAGLLDLHFAQRTVQVSERPIGELPLTYVGHSPVRHVTVHNSYVYIDQGVRTGAARHGEPTPPTVIDHAQFSGWLGGVAWARRTAPRARRDLGRIPDRLLAAA